MDDREADQPYGPNTRLVKAFLERLREAEVAHWLDAAERATASLAQRRLAAERALRAGAGDTKRVAEAGAAVAGVAEFARNVVFLTRHSTQLSLEQVVMMSDVADTAVWALVMRDRLEPADFAILYWPFATAFPVAELEASR